MPDDEKQIKTQANASSEENPIEAGQKKIWRRLKIFILSIVSAVLLALSIITYCVWANISWWENYPKAGYKMWGYKYGYGIYRFEMFVHDGICTFYQKQYCQMKPTEFTTVPIMDGKCKKARKDHCYWRTRGL